jgi:hypothetical protein
LIFVSARTNKRHHQTEQYNKFKGQGGNELAAFLFNTLEKQPGKVLRRAGLTGAEWNEPASVTALFMAAQKHFPSSVPGDTDDDDDTDYDAAAAALTLVLVYFAHQMGSV